MMIRGGIINRAVMPQGEVATLEPMAASMAEAFKGAARETEIRGRVIYAAYNVAYDDTKALAEAQRKPPSLVRVRINGRLELLGIDLAVTAIMNGGTLEV